MRLKLEIKTYNYNQMKQTNNKPNKITHQMEVNQHMVELLTQEYVQYVTYDVH